MDIPPAIARVRNPNHAAALQLFAGEAMRSGRFPQLCYYRRPDPGGRLIVFLTGGGHLARVAYGGHDGADPRDFLDHWLAQHGFGLLALSYPCDHPAFEFVYPEFSVADRATSSVAILDDVLRYDDLSRDVIVIGWSLAGKLAALFARHAFRRGIDVVSFISLAATAPLPGLMTVRDSGEPLTPQALWDIEDAGKAGRDRIRQWHAELERQSAATGRDILPREVYDRDYRANSPLLLRGEALQVADGPLRRSLESTVEDVGAFAYRDYPLVAAIIPNWISDARHALTDQATWGFVNAQSLYERLRPGLGAMSAEQWRGARALADSLSHRLTRRINSGHFFFLGEPHAAQSAKHVAELSCAAREIHVEIERLKIFPTTANEPLTPKTGALR